MLGRIAVAAALALLAGCAGLEPAGRSAGGAPAPAASQPGPTELEAQPQEAPQPTGPVAAPEVSAPAPPPAPAPRSADDDIVVPGQVESQVPPPQGDPRTSAQRTEDIRAWDQCVMQVQAAAERDPMRPQLDSPEEYCASTLGMADRLAVPESRLQRR